MELHAYAMMTLVVLLPIYCEPRYVKKEREINYDPMYGMNHGVDDLKTKEIQSTNQDKVLAVSQTRARTQRQQYVKNTRISIKPNIKRNDLHFHIKSLEMLLRNLDTTLLFQPNKSWNHNPKVEPLKVKGQRPQNSKALTKDSESIVKQGTVKKFSEIDKKKIDKILNKNIDAFENKEYEIPVRNNCKFKYKKEETLGKKQNVCEEQEPGWRKKILGLNKNGKLKLPKLLTKVETQLSNENLRDDSKKSNAVKNEVGEKKELESDETDVKSSNENIKEEEEDVGEKEKPVSNEKTSMGSIKNKEEGNEDFIDEEHVAQTLSKISVSNVTEENKDSLEDEPVTDKNQIKDSKKNNTQEDKFTKKEKLVSGKTQNKDSMKNNTLNVSSMDNNTGKNKVFIKEKHESGKNLSKNSGNNIRGENEGFVEKEHGIAAMDNITGENTDDVSKTLSKSSTDNLTGGNEVFEGKKHVSSKILSNSYVDNITRGNDFFEPNKDDISKTLSKSYVDNITRGDDFFEPNKDDVSTTLSKSYVDNITGGNEVFEGKKDVLRKTLINSPKNYVGYVDNLTGENEFFEGKKYVSRKTLGKSFVHNINRGNEAFIGKKQVPSKTLTKSSVDGIGNNIVFGGEKLVSEETQIKDSKKNNNEVDEYFEETGRNYWRFLHTSISK